jgi:hypothetical protein
VFELIVNPTRRTPRTQRERADCGKSGRQQKLPYPSVSAGLHGLLARTVVDIWEAGG